MTEKQEARKLSIITIATNHYLDFFMTQLGNVNDLVGPHQPTEVIIATNRANLEPISMTNVTVRFVEVEDLPWPEITLLRYEIIQRLEPALKGEVVMWLDADMLIRRAINIDELLAPTTELAMARHPGFLETSAPISSGAKTYLDYQLRNLKRLIRRQPALGSWENRRTSNAFVPVESRHAYVHGAVWLGSRDAVIGMCALLAKRTRDDLSRGLIATWHDESHLNWYHSTFFSEVALLPKHFSAWDGGPWFSDRDSFILSVDKKLWMASNAKKP
jgi:hypothetical protein